MVEKRYQYYSKDGIEWTPWFTYHWDNYPKYQYGRRLLNEYRRR